MDKADVVFINMPFASLYRPSIALSLFQSGLRSRGVTSKILYFTVALADRIGSELYVKLANQYPRPNDQLGEWVFSGTKDPRAFVDEILVRRKEIYGDDPNEAVPIQRQFIDQLLSVRSIAAEFIEQCLDRVLSFSPRIVAFTSVFQQQLSSLALANRIKKVSPGTFVLFGGHNCEGIMGAEVARQFPFIDAVVSGEGDIVLPQIVDRVLQSQSVSQLQGVYTKENVEQVFAEGFFPSAQATKDMDSLPFPDYEDFFEAHRNSTLDPRIERQLLFETARGCWWGERSHCTFCGLSSETMPFRSKSSTRAMDELQALVSRYPGSTLTVVDNIIDMQYFKDLVPELAKRKLNLKLFYETKANLKKEQVRLMREAGFTMVQPGIEGFSSQVLALMGKGITALQNIQVLKWLKEYGIRPYWNLLWGFPGENPEEYRRMAELIPLLTHLPRPDCACKIRMDRFSPNFKFAEKLGFANVRPSPAYFHIYKDVDSEHVANLAYYFSYDYREARDVEGYTAGLWQQVQQWWKDGAGSDLFSMQNGNALLIWDFRPCACEPLTVLTGIQKLLYGACDGIQTIASLTKLTRDWLDDDVPADVERILEPLLQNGLMVRENNSYLSLAVPIGVYQPNASVAQKLLGVVQQYGRMDHGRMVLPVADRHLTKGEIITKAREPQAVTSDRSTFS